MMNLGRISRDLCALAAGCALMTATAAAQDVTVTDPPAPSPDSKTGSLYLQCDGNPNNMSAGESLARLVGAVTLLGLFAPAVESPDSSKRQFGEAGVAACSQLIDGDRAEGKPIRRVPLILGRALHRIEAKDYNGAIADVGRAREEARVAGLSGDPYFDRSMGISLDMIEAEALLRAGDVAAARAVSLRRVGRYPHTFYALIGADEYRAFAPEPDGQGLVRAKALSRISPLFLNEVAGHLEETGQFAEAARVRDSFTLWFDSLGEDVASSMPGAQSALSHALAGGWVRAEALAGEARAKLAARTAGGKPESNASGVVEVLDLYDIVRLAHDGELADARQKFAARSQWLAPGFGQLVAVNALLHAEAPAAELAGGLGKTRDAMLAERRDQALAALLEKDKNNKTLWSRILPYASATAYERLSKPVWNGAKSRYISKEKDKIFGAYRIFLAGDPLTQVDAMLLHSAVTAKARGYKGFSFLMMPRSPSLGWVRFGNPGDAEIPADLYLDADAVISELREVIPTTAEAEARRKVREAVAKGKGRD